MLSNPLTVGPVSQLVVADASGVWVARSAVMAPFFFDCDAMTVGRDRLGDGTPTVFDSEWLRILAIAGPEDRGVVRVGEQHLYLLRPLDDPARGGCWYQDRVELIEPATDVELEALPGRVPAALASAHRSDPREPLVLTDAHGVWAVRSTSSTVYYIDADSSLLLRSPGPGSSRGPGDDRWVPLVSVESAFGDDVGVVRVGERHRYVFDYAVDGPEFGSWLQRAVTAIERVDADELASLPARPGWAV